MLKLQKYFLCFVAGFYAASGSFFGKLPSFLSCNELLTNWIKDYHTVAELLLIYSGPWLLMVFCNLFNWRYFLKALQCCEETLVATVLTAASNYIISFIVSALIFQESWTFLSCLGIICITIGLIFLCEEDLNNYGKDLKRNPSLLYILGVITMTCC